MLQPFISTMASASSSSAPCDDGRRLRGGRNQKRTALEAFVVPSTAGDFKTSLRESDLAWEVVRRWCWGGCSATEVQRLTHKSHADQIKLLGKLGASHEHIAWSLSAIARLGRHGNNSNNIARALIGLLGQPSYPEPITVKIAMTIRKPRRLESKVQEVAFPIMAPHMVVSHLFKDHKTAFDYKLLGIGQGDLRDKLEYFWKEVVRRKDP